MNRYAAALSRHPLPAHAVGEIAGDVLDRLAGADPDLLVVVATAHHVPMVDEIVHAFTSLFGPRVLLATTAAGAVGGGHEVETGPALAAFAAVLPDADLEPVRLRAVDGPAGASIGGWALPADVEGLLLAAVDPFTFPTDAFLDDVAERRPGLRVLGGLASAATAPGGNRLVLDGEIVSDGLVGVVVRGVPVRTVVSQGSRPVGSPYVVTRGSRSAIEELGGRPAVERVHELAEHVPEADRALLARGLQVGFVVDEHRAEFGRGDFLVRDVLGIDRRSGAVVTAERIEVGRTVQFHVRDAAAADEDLRALLADPDLEAAGALLFTCTGRGRTLFGVPDHDVHALTNRFGEIPVAGMTCGGEIGPVGPRSFVHAYTASVALFA